MRRKIFILMTLTVAFTQCDRDDTSKKNLELLQGFMGASELDLSGNVTEGVPAEGRITLVFSAPLNQTSARASIQLKKGAVMIGIDFDFPADGHSVEIYPAGTLEKNSVYTLALSGNLQGSSGETFIPRVLTFKTAAGHITVTSAEIGGTVVSDLNRVTEVPLSLDLTLRFSSPVNTASLEQAADLTGPDVPKLLFSYADNDQTAEISVVAPLRHLSKYQFRLLQSMEGALGESFGGFSRTLYTVADETPKLPVVSDEELLTIVQRQTFRYFWDFAHPESGMARERNTSGNTVTTGGSGFGIMALIVGVERGFISRAEGLDRMDRILTFLESADRFHGVWPHWMNGSTGEVIPFSANDNGGDLVETSFLMQGLLSFRQYLDANIASEKILIDRINALWHTVEWDWYTRGGQNVLYWHWSPDKEWAMNHPIRGYNEALITYFLAAASPTHPVAAAAYHEGWAGNGAIVNGKSYYGITLPVGYDYGGALFFAHYSFLGLDPRNLEDRYARYWTQNVSHASIHQAYSVANPQNFVGYSEENWGLTASDNHQGYSAHSPTNDLGVIAPTAALSSFPYTPEASMKALRFLYYTIGDRLWGPYGFYDAFNLTHGWTADSYLAIDQGPIIVMIENYRTALLWDLFMSAPEVQVAKDKLGFSP